VSVGHALSYAAALGLVGFALLWWVRPLAAAVALVGFIVYVFVYTFSKRYTHLGVLVGSVSGAVPIVSGYIAASGRLDLGALIVFFILVLWQMPHFYAIAIYRLEEYRAAGIPVLPASRGIAATRLEILVWLVLFSFCTLSLPLLGLAGYVYATVMFVLCLAWFARAVSGFCAADAAVWARKLFLFSLIVLCAFSVMLALAPLLP
jgi:protoheme IX farnesyltransferase